MAVEYTAEVPSRGRFRATANQLVLCGFGAGSSCALLVWLLL